MIFHTARPWVIPSLIITAVIMMMSMSCMVHEEFTIYVDDSGFSTFEVIIQEFFLEVLDDYSEFLPEEEADLSRLDAQRLEAELLSSEYIYEAEVREASETYFEGEFHFTDARYILRTAEEKQREIDVFTYDASGRTQQVTIHIDIDNYSQLEELVPILKDPSFSTFGPEENRDVTKEEYLEMVSYMLGEEGPGAIEESEIRIVIHTTRPIIRQSGGRIVTPRQAVFTIPLIDFLLLHDPLIFSVTW